MCPWRSWRRRFLPACQGMDTTAAIPALSRMRWESWCRAIAHPARTKAATWSVPRRGAGSSDPPATLDGSFDDLVVIHLCGGCFPQVTLHSNRQDAGNGLAKVVQGLELGVSLRDAARQVDALGNPDAIHLVGVDAHGKDGMAGAGIGPVRSSRGGECHPNGDQATPGLG